MHYLQPADKTSGKGIPEQHSFPRWVQTCSLLQHCLPHRRYYLQSEYVQSATEMYSGLTSKGRASASVISCGQQAWSTPGWLSALAWAGCVGDGLILIAFCYNRSPLADSFFLFFFLTSSDI